MTSQCHLFSYLIRSQVWIVITYEIIMKNIRKPIVNNRSTNGLNSNSNHKSAIFSEGMNLNYMRTFQSDPNSPKHISISYVSSDHSLVYESVVLFYSLSAFLLQILHLYRTVWWLPQSYEKNALVSEWCVLLWRVLFETNIFLAILF
jgi:hypothetical protein